LADGTHLRPSNYCLHIKYANSIVINTIRCGWFAGNLFHDVHENSNKCDERLVLELAAEGFGNKTLGAGMENESGITNHIPFISSVITVTKLRHTVPSKPNRQQ